eukprot:CAMPEP_0118690736 /NCGR_PEP_ID=MMETSP0800-20121206/10283_1 /TAXON_ID=210618 ORGANISM="Striatella unipunctata, Strain CCMP2910" /NCGR_SAMPLE_ID=MMETSP0800 /ASSEMBLY_ACC=CAM_ASM_000638 /LENGTH=762 /DNA_ID=CAMNT_0006588423 /DNA_START=46 /DNA_END=2334 /DNA_ORIENTATION=-
MLLHLCENATDDNPESWEAVREWLRGHAAQEVRQAAEQLGESRMTSLHLACRSNPPEDIINVFLSIASQIVQWTDGFGWLPIHYACAFGASIEVLRLLAEAFPESKTTVDKRGRTPLHFALGNTERPATPAVVVLLSSSGAASCADDNGMLPLHYACAYGAPEEALYVLIEAFADAIGTTDRKERTPLHFALSNAENPASPSAVRLLLSQNRGIVNGTDRGQHPLHVLASRAQSVTFEQREYVQKCLEHYLNAEPSPTADFLTALQSLPDWLAERAVVIPVVQALLNEKISQRFPTAVLMLDFYFLCAIIVTFYFTVLESLQLRFDLDPENDALSFAQLSPLYIGAVYFLIREVVQMLSLLSLGLFQTWLYDPTNWLDAVFIFLVIYWSIIMQSGGGNPEIFRTGAALSLGLFWTNVLSFLKGMLIDFAVFVGGVFYVVQRLAAFLMALGVILVAFAQMFVTVFQQTSYCEAEYEVEKNITDPTYLSLIVESNDDDRPFCSFGNSFIKVYTMLLGEVDESDFETSTFARVLFVLFMFLVVILLANVLIAIVTDSYGVIKNERAAIVFWSNRLDFVAEMDAISSGPWKRKLKSAFCFGGEKDESGSSKDSPFGTDLWKRLMDLFEDDIEDNHILSIEFWCYTLLRLLAALLIIPLWIALGILSAGWLWPPQVREGIFIQRISKKGPIDLINEVEQRMKQVKDLKKEVKDLQDDVVIEMAVDRKEVVQMKSQLVDMKSEITSEMKHIKRIMTMLFELQSSMEID